MVLTCALAVVAEDVTFLAHRRHWEQLPTSTLMQLGNDFINHKNMADSAMLCYSLIANRYHPDLNDEQLKSCIRATHHIGTIYSDYYHNYSSAYKHLLLAQDLATRHHYDEFMPHVLMSIGNLYWVQEGLSHDGQNAQQALALQREAFWKAIGTRTYSVVSASIINLNYIACSLDRLPQSSKERTVFDNLALPSDSTGQQTLARAINRGTNLLASGHPDQSLEVFINARDHLDNGLRDKVSMHIMLNELVYYNLLKLNEDAQALHTLTQCLDMVRSQRPDLLPEVYGQMAEYHRSHNNPTLADKYELLWWRTTDSIAQATHAGNLNTVQFLHEIDKMNEEHHELVLKQRHDRQLLWVVCGFLLLAMVLLTLLVINRNRIKQKNRALYENNVALLAADEQRRSQVKQAEKAHAEAEASKYGAIRMDEKSAEELWQNIIHVMEYSQEIFDEGFSVARLAELIEAKPNYVSQAINQQPDWTFPTLLAHYRIREACRRMNDPAHYGNYTVEGIGQSVGFTSRSYFVKLFKKHTGLTPSDYIKQARSSTPSVDFSTASLSQAGGNRQ